MVLAENKEIEMNHLQTIDLAEKHIGSGTMVSSAILCLANAKALAIRGEEKYSHERALKSLCYSVGIFHADYQKAAK